MIDKDVMEKEYIELVKEIKNDFPNIMLPSMGLMDDIFLVDINSKDFVINNEEV
jgi:hypothetical protein